MASIILLGVRGMRLKIWPFSSTETGPGLICGACGSFVLAWHYTPERCPAIWPCRLTLAALLEGELGWTGASGCAFRSAEGLAKICQLSIPDHFRLATQCNFDTFRSYDFITEPIRTTYGLVAAPHTAGLAPPSLLPSETEWVITRVHSQAIKTRESVVYLSIIQPFRSSAVHP